MEKFTHFELRLVEPKFDSNLTSKIMELNHLKKRLICGTTKPFMFFQVKGVFHILESLASARIEGNNTTISDYIESKLGHKETGEEGLEISNMHRALDFIDNNIEKSPFNQAFLRKIHKIISNGLSSNKEGCRNPGEFRKTPVKIANSNHFPPLSRCKCKTIWTSYSIIFVIMMLNNLI